MDNLKNKTILVTGANGFIGSNLVSSLINEKSNVIALDIAYKNHEILKLSEGKNNYENIIYLDSDILNEKELIEGIEKGFDKFGSIDGLVNSAAIDFVPNDSEDNLFENLDISNFKKVLDTNISGQVLCSKIVGNLMKSNSIRGSIVNVGSIYGKVSPRQDIYDHIETPNGKYKKPLVYGVSKSALTNFTKYLATYWGENGIRVNNVILGGVMNNQDTELVEKYSKNVPLGRMANIDECISPILFLLSDSSSYITGSDLIVDGGWTSW